MSSFINQIKENNKNGRVSKFEEIAIAAEQEEPKPVQWTLSEIEDDLMPKPNYGAIASSLNDHDRFKYDVAKTKKEIQKLFRLLCEHNTNEMYNKLYSK